MTVAITAAQPPAAGLPDTTVPLAQIRQVAAQPRQVGTRLLTHQVDQLRSALASLLVLYDKAQP